MTDTAPAVKEEREAPASRSLGAGNLIIKIILVGLIDALLIYCLVQAWGAEWWPAVVFFAIVLIAVNAVYFSKGSLPLKYLIPGLIFLVVYQLFTMVFTGYLSFTNYGTGHLDSKDAAIVSIQASNVVPVEGGTEYAVVPIEQDGTVSMLVTDPTTGQVRIGTNEGFTDVPDSDVQRTGEQVTGVTGYQSLNLATLSGSPDLKAQWDTLNPPINAEEGTYLRAISITRAREAKSGFLYDEAQDAMINTQTTEVFPADNENGAFINEASGQSLNPGWTVTVGFSNYVTLFTDQTIKSAFLPTMAWTFAFAILTTFLNFSLGLLLALILQERRMGGKGIYRVLLIIPYGLPVILMALVWQGMLNTDFGIINQILNANIPWLNDPWLARFSVLMVNLWMGFPYFFLVCSGALTAIPGDLKEAAFVDGASGRYAFRTVVLPLLLVATAPLLITTFAFNFNNYTLIDLLTDGGPFRGSVINGGYTDLLINYTLRIAFTPANQQMGLASAISMIIFIIVGTVSAFGFRLTRKLEEIG